MKNQTESIDNFPIQGMLKKEFDRISINPSVVLNQAINIEVRSRNRDQSLVVILAQLKLGFF